MRPVIITADDFGFSVEVNEAVEAAHRDGVLSAVSLMVSGAAAGDAVRRARAMPELRVGLHVVLVQGVPVLPAGVIPALVTRSGRFPDALVSTAAAWFLDASARLQLAREISAQFEAFRATGLLLDHVNGHNHMHIHPSVLTLVMAECRNAGGVPVRLPREPYRFSGGVSARLAGLAGRTGLEPWLRLMRRRLRRAGLGSNDWLLGIADSGHVDEATLRNYLARLPKGLVEIHCHPATSRSIEIAGAMPGYDNEGELAALTSPAVRDDLRRLGLVPAGFRDALQG